MTNRRQFMIQTCLGSGALLAGHTFADVPMVAETETQAAALGYKANATKVDKVKFPQHAAAQQCDNCVLYQGKPTDAAGGCPLFAGKQVAAKGWCSAWAKKA